MSARPKYQSEFDIEHKLKKEVATLSETNLDPFPSDQKQERMSVSKAPEGDEMGFSRVTSFDLDDGS